MATAIELLNTFLNKDADRSYAYHFNDVQEILQERAGIASEVTELKEEIEEQRVALDGMVGATDEMELAGDLETNENILAAMDKVLVFLKGETEGVLITKVLTTQEWQYQEPVFLTKDSEEASMAWNFLNAHAVITAA